MRFFATLLLVSIAWRTSTIKKLSEQQTQVTISSYPGTLMIQIWPFRFLVMVVHQQLGEVYEVDEVTLVISRGTGTWNPRMMLWRPSELCISLFVLSKKIYGCKPTK